MALTTKDWKDFPDTTTPITAAALEDLETRLAAYADLRTYATFGAGSAVALTGATWAKLPMPATFSRNVSGFVRNADGSVTVPTTGLYLVSARVDYDTTALGERQIVRFNASTVDSNTSILIAHDIAFGGSSNPGHQIAHLVWLTAGVSHQWWSFTSASGRSSVINNGAILLQAT